MIMGKRRGLGLHLIFVSMFLVATTYTCLSVGSATVFCSQKERLALLNFKHNIEDDSNMLSSWVGKDCCRWERIQCDGVTGNVEGLYLRGDMTSFFPLENNEGYYLIPDGNYLVGSKVNSSLAELTYLKYLDLSGNDFRGSRIPEFIGSLKKLSYLNLSYAGFYGIIPPHIGNLSNLKVLDLSSNYQLMADDMSWTFGLSSLEHLNLSFVDLGGSKNLNVMFYMMPSLEELSLSLCGLTNADLLPSQNSSRILPLIKHLDLSFNYFKGPLHVFFQNMTSLTFLDLSCMNLDLAWKFANLLQLIPSLSQLHVSNCRLNKTHLSHHHLNFSTLSNIYHLDLSRNIIEGTFPSILTSMSSLRVLDLSRNNLNSSVPIMPNLLELDLSLNMFKQIEHVGIWRQCHMKHLRVSSMLEMVESPTNIPECHQYAFERLYLHWCSIGTFPEPIRRMMNLRVIDLSGNKLKGPIPQSLTRARFLEELDLSDNRLTGPIPTFLGKLSKLDLSWNQLSGLIPHSIGELDALTELHLESNLLTGPIPASIGRLVSLQTISMYTNLLNGTIPLSIGRLTKLQSLDLSDNCLEGVVFEGHFTNLSNLKNLDTSSNSKLTFNVSPEWIPPFQLLTLRLSFCHIANGFPQWLQNQRKLQRLVLSNTTILGPLPTWLQKMPIIPYLDLSYNNLLGTLTNLPNGGNVHVLGDRFTWALFLENNMFNGSIPSSLCRRIDLQYIDLSRNMLTGSIPNCLENLKRLEVMLFSSNRLSGVIPSSIVPSSSSLIWLSLNENNFVGGLPRELGHLQHLRVLDLGGNKFSGNLPEWIGEELTSLMVLRLHNNNFTGRIPQSLCKTSNLQILDVAYNNLAGTIPHCFGELTGMVNGSRVDSVRRTFDSDETVMQVMKGLDLEYTTNWDMVYNMDLSSNKLVGEIPIELTALSKLMGLNLSNNHLSGVIPNSIGNMKALNSLDLSLNELIGIIPTSVATLNFLSHLNLSHNNLSGEIPKGSQLQTFIDPSIYAGNKYLCGPPLRNNCSNNEDPATSPKKKDETPNDHTKEWFFYLDIIGGFATGFWGIIGVLLFKKEWRWKLFIFVEETMDKIYVAVMVRVAKMKRGGEAA